MLNRLSEEELYQIAARALRLWRSDDQDDGGSIETEDKAALLQLAQVSDGDGKCSAVQCREVRQFQLVWTLLTSGLQQLERH